MTTELILVALTLIAIWRTHHLKEFHHYMIGLVVAACGWFWGPMVTLAGICITADDCAEHWCEWLPPSPLHWVFVKLANRLPFLSKLSGWLDRLFGASSVAPPQTPPV